MNSCLKVTPQSKDEEAISKDFPMYANQSSLVRTTEDDGNS